MAIQWPLSPNRGELRGVHQLPRVDEHHVDLTNVKVNSIYAPSIIFSAFCFFVVILVFIVLVLETITKLFFEFEISSFLLSALKNKSLPLFENKQIIFSRSIIYFLHFCCQTCFGNNYQTCIEFEIISSLLLSACKNKSLPIYILIIKVVSRVDDGDPTLEIAPSRSITSSKNTDGAITQEAKPTLIHEEDNGSTIEEGLNIGKSLSCTWTTGAGPRIGVLRDYPAELKIMALEQVNLSPRIKPGGVAFGSSSSSQPFQFLHQGLAPKSTSPRLHYMGLPSLRILKQSQFTK